MARVKATKTHMTVRDWYAPMLGNKMGTCMTSDAPFMTTKGVRRKRRPTKFLKTKPALPRLNSKKIRTRKRTRKTKIRKWICNSFTRFTTQRNQKNKKKGDQKVKTRIEEEAEERYFDNKRRERDTIPEERWCKCRYCKKTEGKRVKYEENNKYFNEDGFRMYRYLRSKGQEVIVPVSEECTLKRRPYILTADLPGTTPEEKPDWRSDGMTGWLIGAKDLGINTRR